jgi:heat shock protein HtpX
MGFSRQREWLADTTAVRVTGRPLALASALEKLAGSPTTLTKGSALAQHLCLAGPHTLSNWWEKMLSTHPDIDERVARLRQMADLQRQG